VDVQTRTRHDLHLQPADLRVFDGRTASPAAHAPVPAGLCVSARHPASQTLSRYFSGPSITGKNQHWFCSGKRGGFNHRPAKCGFTVFEIFDKNRHAGCPPPPPITDRPPGLDRTDGRMGPKPSTIDMDRGAVPSVSIERDLPTSELAVFTHYQRDRQSGTLQPEERRGTQRAHCLTTSRRPSSPSFHDQHHATQASLGRRIDSET